MILKEDGLIVQGNHRVKVLEERLGCSAREVVALVQGEAARRGARLRFDLMFPDMDAASETEDRGDA